MANVTATTETLDGFSYERWNDDLADDTYHIVRFDAELGFTWSASFSEKTYRVKVDPMYWVMEAKEIKVIGAALSYLARRVEEFIDQKKGSK